AATMAEALAHDALLDAAALERQRLRRGHAQLFAGILGRLSHTLPFLYAFNSLAGQLRRSLSGLRGRVAPPQPFQPPATRQNTFARRPGEQRCMYHIWAVQCQIQL